MSIKSFKFLNDEYRTLCGIAVGDGRLELRYTQKSSLNVPLHYVIAHTDEHTHWAKQVQQQIAYSLESVLPGVKLTSSLCALDSSSLHINNTLLRQSLRSGPARSGHSFIITPGWWESQMVDKARRFGIVTIPQLFCLPNAPTKLYEDTMHSLDRRLLGGVYSWPTDSDKYLYGIRALRPGIKQVVVVYNPHIHDRGMSAFLKEQVAALKEAFSEKGVNILTHHWKSDDMGLLNLVQCIAASDAVITLNEPTAIRFNKELSDLCKSRGKLLCASRLDALFDGAVLGFGATGASYAAPLVSLMMQYILDQKRGLNYATRCLPVQLGGFLNEHEMAAQGISFTPEQEALFRMQSIFGSVPSGI